jgi:hypothetical protein
MSFDRANEWVLGLLLPGLEFCEVMADRMFNAVAQSGEALMVHCSTTARMLQLNLRIWP